MGRNFHPNHKSLLTSRSPGINPRVAHAPPATPVFTVLPSQSCHSNYVLTFRSRVHRLLHNNPHESRKNRSG
ncbi:hypothetical protein RSOLAG1IB_11878 [Rhizoctonia solani AG-1 IB]|uniref:Uncharacterized protein n=1 Tax=Thanatephorus cucumeris (strain AG1-IB / isolate 7/3/14) TaxID=1108050 RepID=A0A0B7FGZ7_THACB|nr:hypothetical protein RSOLAG1IB_11878 [Rhizoctonia solani AG-1 IB]